MTTHLYCVLPNDDAATFRPTCAGSTARACARCRSRAGRVGQRRRARRSDVCRRRARARRGGGGGARDRGDAGAGALRPGVRRATTRAAARWRTIPTSVSSLLADMQGFVEMTLILTPSTRRMLRDLEPVLPAMIDPERPGAGREYMESLRAREAATGSVRRSLDWLAQKLTEATKSFVRRRAVHDQVTPAAAADDLASRSAIRCGELQAGDDGGRGQFGAPVPRNRPAGALQLLCVGK